MRGILFIYLFILLLGLFPSSTLLFAQENSKLEYASNKQRQESQEEFKKGYYYYNNMAYEAAISFFRSAIAINPKNDLARYWLGRAYLMSGYNDLAILNWESLLQDSQNTQGLFLQQELESLYVEGFKSSKFQIDDGISFSFLRMLNTKSNPSYITVDNNNNLYISDFYKHHINIYDPNFKKIGVLKEGLKQPVSVVFQNNLAFVSSFGTSTIRVYDIENKYKFLYEFGGFGFSEGKLAGPVGLAFYKDRLYVVDQGNNRVQIFQTSPKPYFIGQFGKRGNKRAEFNIPTGISIFNEQVWVLDRMNHRIQVFDLEGNYIKQISSPKLLSPIQSFVFQNHLYIVDQDAGVFILHNDTLNLIQSPTQGLQRISSAWMDNNGVLFLSEINNPNIIAYTQDSKKISSLNLRTTFITISAYPKIVMKLRARDSQKKDIKGLNSSNMTVMQDGYKIKNINMQPLIPINKKVALTILIRDTLDTKKSKDNIVQYINRIIDTKDPEDKIRLMAYNSKKQVILNFSNSALALKDSLSKYQWNNEKILVSDDILDQAIYDSIDSNEFNDSYNAVLVIDNNTEVGFSKYSEEVISSHSEKVGVPIYVVNLDTNSKSVKEKSLKFLANKSQGTYFSFGKSNDIFNIFPLIKNNSPLFYTLSYTNPKADNILTSYWANVVLRLEYRSLHGVDQLGYLVNL